jgi:hypothetical protein
MVKVLIQLSNKHDICIMRCDFDIASDGAMVLWLAAGNDEDIYLATTSLTISENANVITIQERSHEWFDVFIYFHLLRFWFEACVKLKPCLRAEHITPDRTKKNTHIIKTKG